jgi:hypothetical protein
MPVDELAEIRQLRLVLAAATARNDQERAARIATARAERQARGEPEPQVWDWARWDGDPTIFDGQAGS